MSMSSPSHSGGGGGKNRPPHPGGMGKGSHPHLGGGQGRLAILMPSGRSGIRTSSPPSSPHVPLTVSPHGVVSWEALPAVLSLQAL